MSTEQSLTDQEISSLCARELLKSKRFCILDTETTGLGRTAEICQLAVIDHEGKTLIDTLIEPTVKIEPGATAIHGITKAHVEGKGGFDQHLIPLLQAVRDKDVVIYNASFDLKLLQQSARPYGIWLSFPISDRDGCLVFTNGGNIHCAMHWYSQWIGEWNDYYGNYKWQPLPGGDHTALGDCLATLEVIKRMASES